MASNEQTLQWKTQWSNWGGINDVLRNQEFSSGLRPSDYTFGGILGATNFNLDPLNKEQELVYPMPFPTEVILRESWQHILRLSREGWALTIAASRREAS